MTHANPPPSKGSIREQDESQLIPRAQDGDNAALEELIRRHEAQVFRFGQRMCRNSHDAEDIVQDTFLAMTRTFDGFRGASSVSTWLYTIARSFCIKKRRRSKYAPSHIDSLEQGAAGDAMQVADQQRLPDEQAAGAEIQAALNKAIAGLKPMYREVLVLRDVEGLTAPEVSEVLGITAQAVKSRLHRAREMVRGKMLPVLQNQQTLPPVTSATCKSTAQLFSQHMEGEIDADTCKKMEQHMASCPHCEAVCGSLRETLAACRRAGDKEDKVPNALQQRVRRAVHEALQAGLG